MSTPSPSDRRGFSSLGPNRRKRIWRALIRKYGWICQWCLLPIDPSISYCYDPMHKSVDHIIDVANGGTNRLDNLQPMHRKCNEEKRNIKQ